MPDFNFEHLDDKNFERMAAGLCTEHIARGLRIFGSGTDGGREATFEGKTHYPTPADPWEGYIVVQCKQKQTQTGATPKEETDWAIGQLNTEMKKYETAKKKRRRPEYFLFITNARMSAQQDTGGKDRFVERLYYWVERLKLKGADVWERDKLNSLVDLTPRIAQRFGLLHSGNLIHYAAQEFLKHQDDVETTLSVFLQEELRIDQFVLLGQAHANDDKSTHLARVFVDLKASPVTDPQRSFHIVKELQQVSDRPLHPTLLKEERQAFVEAVATEYTEVEYEENEEADLDALLEEHAQLNEFFRSLPGERHENSRFMIVGGPGQGKSTLGQHLAQRHRAALLRATEATKTLETSINQLVRLTEEAAGEAGMGLPTYPRWPFRITLENFAGDLAKKEVSSVLEYIAALVRRRTKRAFDQRDAETLLANMPVFVAFDGLDEVPAVSNRAEVLDAVRRFLFEARDIDADLLVIATTRPQGYRGEFAQFDFNQLALHPLSKEEALVYARKFVDVKYASDADRREKVMKRLEAAAKEEAIARLMRSPLQVTIMAALVDQIGILPRERYSLFERYYELIYLRELERGLALSTVLSEYRQAIEILHDRVGLLLQIEAESKEKHGRAESRISTERLTRIVHNYLVQKEHEGEELERLTSVFMDVALHRLVFIVPLEDERYGFEVRSLQEFSAARALMRGDYSIVKKRLRAIAPLAYWRNTVLFAIGQAFAKHNEELSDMALRLCSELDDNDDPLLFRTLAGSRLALDILNDGIVELQPDYRKRFVKAALPLVHIPSEDMVKQLAALYTSRDEALYKKEVQAALSSSEIEALIAPFTLLAVLTRVIGKAPWAESLLPKHWPTDLRQQQIILEHIGRQFRQTDWFKQVVADVALASSLRWVSTYLPGFSEITWIRDAGRLRHNRRKKIYLESRDPIFYYHYNTTFFPNQQPLLGLFQELNLVEYDWQPFILGRAFMLDPTPETLADTLEALVHSDNWQPNRGYVALPWQLAPLLTDAKSTDELLHHAQRARAGELGTAQDWQAAEQRWVKSRFTVDDLVTFSDAEWPYTGKIAQYGIFPFESFGTESDHVDEDSAEKLLQAFNSTKSDRYRVYIACSFLFTAGRTYDPSEPFTLPLATLIEVTLATDWQVYALDILGLLDRELDWVEEVKSLDVLGSRISMLGNKDDAHPVVEEILMPEALAQLLPLVGTKKVREGILRFLAAFAIAGAEVPVPNLNLAALSFDGRVAWATLNLFSEAPMLSAADLTQLVVGLWEYPHPKTDIYEVRQVLHPLLERERLLSPAIAEVLDNLYRRPEVAAHIKVHIIRSLTRQIQYRTSELDNPVRKKELSMDWLFDVISS
jgi:hypothetical protein